MKKRHGILLFIFIIGLCFYAEDFAMGIAVCELAMALTVIYFNVSEDKTVGFNLLVFYSIFSLLYMVGNIAVLYFIDTPNEMNYNYYLVKENLAEASLISLVGYYSLVLGYSLKIDGLSKYKLEGYINDSILEKAFFVIFAYQVLVFIFGFDIRLLNLLTYPFLFLYIKHAIQNRSQSYWVIVLLALLVLKGLLYSYRRQEAFEPFVIFFLSVYVAYQGRLQKMLKWRYILIAIFGIFIASQFDTLGKVRAFSGEERFQVWMKNYEGDDEESSYEEFEESILLESEKNILARSSIINQESQVVKLVNDNGYYNGSTMEYVFFAFIPRWIWAEKPLIMQGRWFANEAGLAYNHGDTNSLADVNNSINMTVAGELYINFSFWGVIIGMLFIGWLLQYSWQLCDLYDPKNSLPGAIWGFFLLAVSYFYLQVDLQFIVNYVQVFIMVIILNAIMKRSVLTDQKSG